jgi:hypothetical protein
MLNLMRDIIKLIANTGSMKMTPAKMWFENKYGRFTDYAPTRLKQSKARNKSEEKKEQKWEVSQPPWAADRAEIDFVDKILPSLVRLPKSVSNGGKFPHFFSDTLTFAHTQLFFSGIGDVIIRLLPSIEDDQRQTYLALIRGVAPVYYPVASEDERVIFQVQYV